MNKYFYVIIAVIFFACSTNQEKSDDKNNVADQNGEFDRFKEQFVEELWKTYPGWASYEGYHKYDDMLVVPDSAATARENQFIEGYLDSLQNFEISSLSSNNQSDFYLIENFLNSAAWSNNEFKSWEWNPSAYNVGGSFAIILNGTYDNLDNRLRSILKKLENVPAFYEAAKANINKPTVVHTDLAISQNRGSVNIFGKTLADSVAASGLSAEEKEQLLAGAEKAQEAINGYANWLETEIRPTLTDSTARSFRLGKALYAQKFQYDIVSDYSVDELYQKAINEKKRLHEEMSRLAGQLWTKYYGDKEMPEDKLAMTRMIIDTLSVNHVHRDSFINSVRNQLPQLEDFIRQNDLIFLDPEKPLVVRETPEYMRGIAGASVSAPGPYDKKANTYYNVSPLDDMPEEQAESWLREYNHYIMQILNIHEAIPGHYTQLVYSNESPSIIKSIFGNGAMVEGWAVYTERMMLEEGYGNNDPALWLMYYKWNLRTVCNTILDYSVHVLDMTEDEAMNLLVNEAFQQEAEAKGKWRRVTLTQVQLTSYFNGYSEIYDFRDEYKKRLADKFKLKEFHEKFLGYGSAPVRYIRKLMLEELDNTALTMK